MKNKFKLLGLITGLVLAPLASCNLLTTVHSIEDNIIVDDTTDGYLAVGTDSLHVGEKYFDEWARGTNNEFQHLTATSISDVRSYDNALADSISNIKLKGLYTLKNVGVGDTKTEGWDTYWGPNKTRVDGHFCLKIAMYKTDLETNTAEITMWLPQFNCKVISLTPKTYRMSPNFSETPDENGYDYNTNPVITKAGIYNLTLAKFQTPIDEAYYGIGATLIEEKPEAQPAKLKCRRVIGSIDGWNEREATYIFDSNNQCTLDLINTDYFQVAKYLVDNTTSYSGLLDARNVVVGKELLQSHTYNEIQVLESGNYTLTLNLDEINGNSLDIVKNTI